jgi:ADP-ribosyl-[dinitrogen reductase] hydrolase
VSDMRVRTSKTHPIRVDFVDQRDLRLSGKLGMTLAPGVKDDSARGGPWKRDLDADLRLLKEDYDVDVLVSLLEGEEYERYGIPDLFEGAENVGIEVLGFPIVDVSVPKRAESERYAELIERIMGLLRGGKTVVIHCRGGLGRTGTVVASALVARGYSSGDSIEAVRHARRGTLETPEQEQYVRRFDEEWSSRTVARPRSGRGVLYREPTQIERYKGCLLGLAVGDALGTTLEFKAPGTFRPIDDLVGGGPFDLRAGEWTDDTSMALCLAESLIEKRGFDPADQLTKYLRWYREGYMSATGEFFDIGGATRDALERFEETGEPYAGSTDPYSAGNGSIMRLAPVPMFYAQTPLAPSHDGESLEAVERAGESSRTTHGARTTVDACRYLGALIVGALNGADKEELLSEHHSPVGPGYWKEHPLVDEVDEVARGSFKRREPPEIQGSGYVVRSLEAALWAFCNSDSFREGALLAVNLGDDADTTGAVYGQLAGGFYAEGGIPKPWRRKLAHRLLIEYFAERLVWLGVRGRNGGTQDPS